MKIAVLIVTYNRFYSLSECIESILNGFLKPNSIFVVDNGSQDSTSRLIKEKFPDINVISLENNIGPAGGAETGQKEIFKKGFDTVWMVDDDAKADKEALKKLVDIYEENKQKNRETFLLTSVIYGDANLSQPFYNLFLYSQFSGLTRRIETSEYKKQYFEVNIASMCGLFIPSEVFQKVGFVRGNFFGWYDDTEFILRAQKKGFKIYAVPDSKIYHPVQYRKRIKILGKNFTFLSGRPIRMYYGTRNNIITQREMLPRLNFYFLFLPLFILKRGASIIIFYENKMAFIKYMLKGILDAFKPLGGYND